MKQRNVGIWGTVLAIACLSGCGGGEEAVSEGDRGLLDAVKERGRLICGVSGQLPGFSFVNEEGRYVGMDVDVCRAIAAAIFDDPEAVEFRNLNATDRFTSLQSGEIDVLSRNTTWTTSRDTTLGLDFAPVVFYDGQGLMVRADSAIARLEDLEGKTICTQTGTSNEQNLAEIMRQQGIPYTPLVFEDVNVVFATYQQGRCDAFTADRSSLVSRRTSFPNPGDHVVLDLVLSKEPLAPAVANGDAQWFDIIKWTVYALIEAEELGITSENVQSQLNRDDPRIKRFLGQTGTLGETLGLENDFTVQIITRVGNYGEIYDRHLGRETPLDLPRGQNALWTEGGLMYSPPFR